MNALDKLLSKISSKERRFLRELLAGIKDSETRKFLDMKKLGGKGDYFRAKKGRFRIIFHFENGRVEVDEVRLRNEGTYQEF